MNPALQWGKRQLKPIREVLNYLPENLFIGPLVRIRTKRTRTINGFKMTLDMADGGIGGGLWRQGYREKAFMHILGSEIEPGSTVVDLGANIGYTALHMCRAIGPAGNLIAIEPDPRNIAQLQVNLGQNGLSERIEIHQIAISDHDGTADFFLSDQPNLNSMQPGRTTVSATKVKIESLSTFFASRSDFPVFIKMDVEGHEVEILDGGYELISSNTDPVKILIEVHPNTYSEEHSLEHQIRRYSEIGFTVKYVVSTPVAIPPQFAEKGYKPIIEFQTDGRVRGSYEDISFEDSLKFACHPNTLQT